MEKKNQLEALEAKWEKADFVEEYEEIEVREYEKDGKRVYICNKEGKLIDNFDFYKYIDFFRSEVHEWLEKEAMWKLEELNNEDKANEYEFDEKLDAVIDKAEEDAFDDFVYEWNYTLLQYYYEIYENEYERENCLAELCSYYFDKYEYEWRKCLIVTKKEEEEN